MKFNKINNIIIISCTILVCLSTLSRANDVSPFFSRNYVNEAFSDLCKDDIVSLNFAKVESNTISPDFISSSLITCINLTNNYITSIARDAFRKLPKLTTLFLSDNRVTCNSFYLDGHENLKVLVMNNYQSCNSYNSYNSYSNYNGYSNIAFKTKSQDVQQITGKYQNLQILSLSNNNITDLQYSPSYQSYDLMSLNLQEFTPFPKLRFLDLSNNNIKTGHNFVTLLPKYSLGFLDLHENSLVSLKLNEKGENVYTLILDNNKIEQITWQSNELSLDLIDMKTLVYLSISNNRINDIQLNAFKDTTKLEFLNLSGNAINTLHRDTFSTLTYLSTVDLSSNQINNVPLFSNELNISTLFLHCNQINKITSYAFAWMPKLKKLSLRDNDIQWIDNKTFAKLSVLEELDLSKNKLSFLPQEWAESLMTLKYLDLSENNFTSLESLSLTSMISMRDLYFMKNSLKYLNIGYFEYLPQNLTVHLLD